MSIFFVDYYIILFYLLIITIVWSIFFKLNFINLNLNFLYSEEVSSKYIFKKLPVDFYIKLNYIFSIFFLNFFFINKSFNILFWWNNFKLNNFIIYILLLVYLLNFFFLQVLNTLKFNNEVYKTDYFFTLINIICFVPLLFLTNNLLVFFFFLELSSCILFYKFLVSSVFYENKKKILNFIKINKSNDYLNMLFFQYWTAFFSSILFVFVILNLLYSYNTTEWYLINYLFYINDNFFFTISNSYNVLIFIAFNVAFFFKLGFSPIHFYKLEIYKGLSYISIFFYTTIFFLYFFLFFAIIVLQNMNLFYIFNNWLLVVLLVTGVLLVVSMLFDATSFKVFFAYSSVVNSLSFFILLFSII